MKLHVKSLADQDEIYKSGLLSLLKTNGPHLEHLTLPVLPSNVSIFEILDQAKCKLLSFDTKSIHTDYTKLLDLCQSNQAKSIKSLNLYDNVKFSRSPFLKRMKGLESLVVKFQVDTKKATTIDLSKHSQVYPISLKYLFIQCFPSTLVNITTADTIDMVEFPETDTLNTITHPHLSRIALNLSEPVSMTLLVPCSHVDLRTVYANDFKSSYYALIEILDDNKSVLFELKKGGLPVRVSEKPFNWPQLDVKVKSAKKVEIQGDVVHL